jgi:hypothetical protein
VVPDLRSVQAYRGHVTRHLLAQIRGVIDLEIQP